MLLLLLGGAALLLAIACVNVVSLLLVRSEGRKRELAVRSTLGASNGRLIRQFVTEAFVLVASGSALGLLFASSAVQLLFGLISEDMRGRMPYLDGVGMNPRVAACAGVLAVVATAIFSLAPAVRVRFSELREGLAEGTRGSSGNTWRRLGFKLVVLELATAMVLLVGAGLLGQSLYRLLNVDLGFEPDRLATMQVAAPGARFEGDEQQLRLGREVVSRVARLPGVQSVGLVDLLPVTFNGNTNWIRFVGRPYNGEHNEVNSRVVSAGYFATVRARLLRGRGFTDADTRRRTSRGRHQPDPGEEVLPRRRSDRKALRRHVALGAIDERDRRDRGRHQGRGARRGDLAGRVRAVRAGSGQLLHRRRAHLADRGVGAAGDECCDSRHRSRHGHQARHRHAGSHPGLAGGVPAAVVRLARRRVCRARAAARHRRALRGGRLLGEPAHARDRPASGDGRAAAIGLRADSRGSREADRGRASCWASCARSPRPG